MSTPTRCGCCSEGRTPFRRPSCFVVPAGCRDSLARVCAAACLFASNSASPGAPQQRVASVPLGVARTL